MIDALQAANWQRQNAGRKKPTQYPSPAWRPRTPDQIAKDARFAARARQAFEDSRKRSR